MSQASEQIASQFSSAAGNRKAWYDLIYNVKDPAYGAKGDGVTDDTTAIQAAINAIGTAGSGILWFPAGGTYLTGPLYGVSNMTVMGYNAVLKLKNATNNNIFWNISQSNVRFYGLEFDGNKSNQTILGPLIGLYFQDCTDVHVQDCIAHDIYGIGFGANCTNRGKWLSNVSYNNANNGFDLNGDFTTVSRVNQGNTNIEIAENIAYGNAGAGIFFGHGICKFSHIHHNRCFSNTETGFLMGESSDSVVASNSFSQNIIDANILTGNGLSGLTCYCPRNCKFFNNICNDNTGQGLRLSRVVAGQPFPKDNQVFGNECSNIVGATQTYGIQIDGSGDFNEIKNNTCLANTTTDISRSGASDIVYDNRVTGGYQHQTGTITTGSIAAGGVAPVTVNITGYISAPKILLTVTSTTGHEKFIAHVDTPTNASFIIRVNNLDAALAGTATVRWDTDGGI